jgi:hypothetical protein
VFANATKISYLKNTFSNAAKVATATIPKLSEYYAFSNKVARIITNLEGID